MHIGLAYLFRCLEGEKMSDEIKKLDEPTLRERAAARFLGVSLRTIIRWRQSGKIPYCRVGHTILYMRESLIGMLKKIEVGGLA